MESDDTTHYERQPIASACPSGVMNTTVMHDGTPVVEREDFVFPLPLHGHHGDGRRGGWWERVGGGDRATVAAVTSTQSVERAHV